MSLSDAASAAGDGLTVRVDEPLSRHTAARTGGPCDAFVVVHRPEALARVVADCRAAGWTLRVLGAGTRVAFRDGPVPGVVMRLGTGFSSLRHLGGGRWEVGGAVPVPALVAAAREAGHAGLEFLATVPGSVGASLAFEAGWAEVAEVVRSLHHGRIREGDWEASRGRKRIFCGVVLALDPSTPGKVGAGLDRALRQGRPVHPGSWYEHPKRGSVREVLTSVQLPLVRLRRVVIPDGAPELVVNLGGGTAADMALLHRSAVQRVKVMLGVELGSRVMWIGASSAE